VATTLAFPPREAYPLGTDTALSLGIGNESPAEINSGFFEDLRGYVVPPGEPGYLLGDGAIGANDEDPTGVLALLPGVDGVDQVEPRPWNSRLRIGSTSGKSVYDQLQTLVVGKPRSPCIPGKQGRLR
jgi:hypothetical protein